MAEEFEKLVEEFRPIRPTEALHESVFSFDHELEARKAAGPKRKPAAGS